jgi:hypothetical protein
VDIASWLMNWRCFRLFIYKFHFHHYCMKCGTGKLLIYVLWTVGMIFCGIDHLVVWFRHFVLLPKFSLFSFLSFCLIMLPLSCLVQHDVPEEKLAILISFLFCVYYPSHCLLRSDWSVQLLDKKSLTEAPRKPHLECMNIC